MRLERGGRPMIIGSTEEPARKPSAADIPRFLPAAQRERMLREEYDRDEDLYPLGPPVRG